MGKELRISVGVREEVVVEEPGAHLTQQLLGKLEQEDCKLEASLGKGQPGQLSKTHDTPCLCPFR